MILALDFAFGLGRGGIKEADVVELECPLIVNGPAADLGAVELEGVEPQGFGSGEAVRARREASQAFPEEAGDRFGPSSGVVTAGSSWNPRPLCRSDAGAEVIGDKSVEAAAR